MSLMEVMSTFTLRFKHFGDALLFHQSIEHAPLFRDFCNSSHTAQWLHLWPQLTDVVVDELVGRAPEVLYVRARCFEVFGLTALLSPILTELLHRDANHREATGHGILDLESLVYSSQEASLEFVDASCYFEESNTEQTTPDLLLDLLRRHHKCIRPHTHAPARTHTHTCTHMHAGYARTHARTHARTRAHACAHTCTPGFMARLDHAALLTSFMRSAGGSALVKHSHLSSEFEDVCLCMCAWVCVCVC